MQAGMQAGMQSGMQSGMQGGLYTNQGATRVVGADAFLDMVTACRPAPDMVYDSRPFVEASHWNSQQTPMVPYTMYATP